MSTPIHPIYNEDVVAAWAASAPQQRLRWKNAVLVLGILGTVMLLGVLFGHFSGFFCTVFFFMIAVNTCLAVNAKRRCPACSKVPDGSRFGMQFLPAETCFHCNHWLIKPYGRGRTGDTSS